MREDNTIQVLCKSFALRIIKLYTYLKDNKQEYVLSKQVLRSGTSIGANARESINAQSDMDFINKLSIALKEANETQYWLELLYESNTPLTSFSGQFILAPLNVETADVKSSVDVVSDFKLDVIVSTSASSFIHFTDLIILIIA